MLGEDIYCAYFVGCLGNKYQQELLKPVNGQDVTTYSGKAVLNTLYSEKRSEITVYMVTCALFTWYLTFLVAGAYMGESITTIYKNPPEWTVLVTRLICAIIFHFFAMSDVTSSSVNLKFVSMHPTMFTSNIYVLNFFLCVKIGTAILVEVIQVVILINQQTHMDCIANFMAMQTILNFDSLFYIVLRETSQTCLKGAEMQLPFKVFRNPKLEIELIKKEELFNIEEEEKLQLTNRSQKSLAVSQKDKLVIDAKRRMTIEERTHHEETGYIYRVKSETLDLQKSYKRLIGTYLKDLINKRRNADQFADQSPEVKVQAKEPEEPANGKTHMDGATRDKMAWHLKVVYWVHCIIRVIILAFYYYLMPLAIVVFTLVFAFRFSAYVDFNPEA